MGILDIEWGNERLGAMADTGCGEFPAYKPQSLRRRRSIIGLSLQCVSCSFSARAYGLHILLSCLRQQSQHISSERPMMQSVQAYQDLYH